MDWEYSNHLAPVLLRISTMKFTPIAVIALALASSSARADQYDFSYTLADSGADVVSGTFSGTQVGNEITGYVTGITVETLDFDGLAAAGIIYNDSITGPNYDMNSGGAVVWYALDENNFVFASNDIGNNAPPVLGGVNFTLDSDVGNAFGLSLGFGLGEFKEDNANGTWSLTDVSSVPDSSSSLELVGLGLAGLAAGQALRSRRSMHSEA
jgi:hypothetical protein